jgi:glycolate dehydrogenase FAD-binding subunit
MRTRTRTRTKAVSSADYEIDGRAPANVVTPADEDELSAVLRGATEKGDALVAFGGGTLQGIGNAPRRFDLAVSSARFNAVLTYDHHDLTIGVGAGMTLGRFAATLARNRQFVPLDAPRVARSTVGGTLAAGWSGPRRAAYGRPRDLLIGTSAVLADGAIAHAGGMVVKNVTGYDVSKLYVGSLGTLAIITRANFKTLPMPASFRLAIAPLPEGTRERAVANVRDLDVEPTAALLFQGFREVVPFEEGLEGALLLLFEGSAVAVDRATRGMRSALGAAGVPETRIVDAAARETFQRVIDAYVATISGRSLTLRALGLPSDAFARERAAREAIAPTATFLDTIVDLRSGDLIARIFVDGKLDPLAVRGTLADAVAALRERIPDATLLARGLALEEIDAWGELPNGIETMRALKERFDPKGTLAPGRFVGGI